MFGLKLFVPFLALLENNSYAFTMPPFFIHFPRSFFDPLRHLVVVSSIANNVLQGHIVGPENPFHFLSDGYKLLLGGYGQHKVVHILVSLYYSPDFFHCSVHCHLTSNNSEAG